MAKTCEVVKLTKRTVDAARPLNEDDGTVRQRLYLDAELPGFGLCVGSTAKTFFAQRSVRGRSVRVTIDRYGVLTVDQARREARQLLAKMARGEDPVVERRAARVRGFTLAEALALKTESAQVQGRAAKTIKHYAALNTYLKDWLDRPLAQITRQDVRARHLKLAANIAAGRFAKGRARNEGHGRQTADKVMRMFRASWNRALRERPELPSNPCINIDWFNVKREKAELPLSQLHTWHKQVMALDNPIRRDYLLFTLHTGQRRTSAATARWDDVDFEQRVLHVPNPKGGSAFDLPLTSYLVEMLNERRRQNAELFENSPWIFPAGSKSGHIAEPREEFDGVKWTPHDLRRWFIQTAESLECSPYTIKLLVNHRLPAADVTAGYMRHEVERARPAMEAIGERLRVLCSPPEAKVIKLPRVGAKRKRQAL